MSMLISVRLMRSATFKANRRLLCIRSLSIFPKDASVFLKNQHLQISVQKNRLFTTLLDTLQDQPLISAPPTHANRDNYQTMGLDELSLETDKVLQALQQQSSFSSSEISSTSVHLERTSMDELLMAWMQQALQHSDFQAAKKAHELLSALAGQPQSSLAPDTAMYNVVLHAYASCHGRVEAAEACEALLQDMIQQSRNDSSIICAPTVKTFNIVLNAWAKSQAPDAGKRAEHVFGLLEDAWCQSIESDSPITPNARTLTAVMDAWVRSRDMDAPDRVLATLEVAVQRKQEQAKHSQTMLVIKPDVIMFNTAMLAWVQSDKGRYGAEKAESIFQWMKELHDTNALGTVTTSTNRSTDDDDTDAGVEPTTQTYCILIDAWARANKSSRNHETAERAQAWLQEMLTRYQQGHHKAKPNVIAFTTCIKAWGKQERQSEACAQRAQEIYNQLIQLYRDTQEEDLRPTPWCANALISVWARTPCGDAPDKAEAVLESIKEFCRPDLYTYNTVMSAHGNHDNTLRALQLFEELQHSTTMQPDVVSYNTALEALGKQRQPAQAQALLEEMKASTNVKPDLRSYTSVIHAWGRSKKPGNATMAIKLLQDMMQDYRNGNDNMKPDVVTLTAAINAASSAVGNGKDKRAALKFAISTFEQAKTSPDLDNPNHHTYNALLKACARLSKSVSERIRLLEQVFDECRQAGLVSSVGLETLRQGNRFPKSLQEKYGIADSAKVPASWCVHTNAKDRPPTIKDIL